VNPRVEAWRDGGELVSLGGHRIFVRERPGDTAGPPILFLHGYPSSSYDWRGLLDQLPGRRAVCFDFLGFGLSDKPRDHVYSLMDQADLAEAVWRRYIDEPVLLVGHDMGTSVANELMARDIEGRLDMKIAAALLFNGSMIIAAASLTPAQKVLRTRFGPLLAALSSERFFRANFRRLFSDDHPLSDEEAAEQWALLAHNRGHRIIHKLTHYLHERVTHAERWSGAIRDWPGRLEVAWGMRDPVATGNVLDAVLELRPRAPVVRWPELGHYPQLEDPAVVAARVEEIAADLTPAGSRA
jgi:pimeloyl-ACP methyl ester carboxylesterase